MTRVNPTWSLPCTPPPRAPAPARRDPEGRAPRTAPAADPRGPAVAAWPVAWATPTVALGISAPALAASCTPRTFTTDLPGGYARASNSSATSDTQTQTGADPVRVTITAAANSGTTLHPQNLTTSTAVIGGAQRTAVAIAASTSGQTVAFRFSRAVTGLTFLLSDRDRTANSWRDRIVFSGTPGISQRGSNVAGNGTSNSPLTTITNGGSVDTDSADGNARVTYAGTISSFTMTYSSSSGTATQVLYMSSMQFTAAGCAGTA